jgi:hypothetical protein
VTADRLLRLACLAVGGWILVGLALVSAVHVDDRYRDTHASGAWMALAQYVRDGTLYPPLYDGERFGGTRFMPLQFVLHGGLAEGTGEYLVSGKLLVAAVALALLGTIFVALRGMGVPGWLGVALLGLLVTTHSGLTATTSIRGDALPATLQLGAVLVVARWGSRRAAAAAGLLCAAALLAKISAVWAPAAIVVWLLLRDRRRLPSFAAAFVAPAAAALVLVELLSDGRFSDNVLGLAASAVEGPGATLSLLTTKPLTLLDSDAAAISIVLPLALTDLVLTIRARRIGLEHLAFAASALVTLALMADIGAVSNHLLDFEVLTVLLVGHLFAVHGRLPDAAPVVAVVVPLAVLWAATSTYLVDMHGDVRTAARAAIGRESTPSIDLLERLVPDGSSLLAEDPTIEVTRGRHPTVLDPFMLLRILRERPEWEAELVRRIDAREFDHVVLLTDHVGVDGGIDVAHPRWRREHFGQPVIAAIARNYAFRSFARAYAVYSPRVAG